jgi:hypothetical protein
MNRKITKLKLEMINYQMKQMYPFIAEFHRLRKEYDLIKATIGLGMVEEWRLYDGDKRELRVCLNCNCRYNYPEYEICPNCGEEKFEWG